MRRPTASPVVSKILCFQTGPCIAAKDAVKNLYVGFSDIRNTKSIFARRSHVLCNVYCARDFAPALNTCMRSIKTAWHIFAAKIILVMPYVDYPEYVKSKRHHSQWRRPSPVGIKPSNTPNALLSQPEQ
ncbi:hypothetical protein EUX98_g5382 [Antrodiella citrinella]|uniref:Uncharacterized protein n=1 Tax=Antrodiella citrinella TaxID=2447956 RepID=A0A4S4MRN9_9APHY|nr:hypothetical protein EUX98_g5382 [Antrodiella citrinella]